MGSSRSFIEKFYSSFNHNNSFNCHEAPLSPVSKVSSPDNEKTANNNDTSGFSLENSPNPTQESEIKTNLVKKFEDFLENLRTDELITNEDEIFNRFIKINSTKNRSKTPESTWIINKSPVSNENLMRKYENLMIANSELDLELINANMQIREKNNKKVKGLLEIQREINSLQEENEKLFFLRDSKKGKLAEFIRELKKNEEIEGNYQMELNEIISNKTVAVKKIEKNETNNEKLEEIEKKKIVLKEIQEKNGKIIEKIKEIEKLVDNGFDLNEIRREIQIKDEKIDGIRKKNERILMEIEENTEKNNTELRKLSEEIKKVENEEKNDEKHKILNEKYEEPIERMKREKHDKLKENEEIDKKYEEKSREIAEKIVQETSKISENHSKLARISRLFEGKIAEILEKVSKSKENNEISETSKDFLKNELKTLEQAQQSLEEDKKATLLGYSARRTELLGFSKKLMNLIEEERQKCPILKKDRENARLAFSVDKVEALKDLRKKMALMKDLRNQLGEEISQLQTLVKQEQQEFDRENNGNHENSSRCEELNREVSELKEKIAKCSKENEEICGKFKVQIDENCAKEKEIKELLEVNEKFRVLTETQMNEISAFNEKTNGYYKEIQILEKKDLKEWNNYLKEKEKAAKKKKK